MEKSTQGVVEGARLSDAAGRAHELLDVALLFGREGTLHRFSDLAAEYQLTRPGPARDQLVARRR